MSSGLTDTRIERFDTLASPRDIQDQHPATESATQTVIGTREAIRAILQGRDRRLLIITGPCSIHDPEAGLEYGRRLAALGQKLSDTLLIVMRVYFEKPRTTVGWKGLINDPGLDGTFDVNRGLHQARKLLVELNELGVGCATEFLDPIVPQYISDLVSWAAIGARTTESQTHREMASGLSMPVGFKNATDGGLTIALNGMTAARQPHTFLGITPEGKASIVRTQGNPDVHLVLRGGTEPNYKKPHLAFAKAATESLPVQRPILVDCSHGNSQKDHKKQAGAFNYLVELIQGGETALLGMMLESNLVEGNQKIKPQLTYGQSITDACMGWETTEALLNDAHRRLSTSPASK